MYRKKGNVLNQYKVIYLLITKKAIRAPFMMSEMQKALRTPLNSDFQFLSVTGSFGTTNTHTHVQIFIFRKNNVNIYLSFYYS